MQDHVLKGKKRALAAMAQATEAAALNPPAP
jgi:hypothetical protein